MTKRATASLAAATMAAAAGLVWAQEREDRTLLSWAQMRALADEASGEALLGKGQASAWSTPRTYLISGRLSF